MRTTVKAHLKSFLQEIVWNWTILLLSDGNRDSYLKAAGKELKLQVDDEDYLIPSPHASSTAKYMDLVGDASASSEGKEHDAIFLNVQLAAKLFEHFR